MAKRRKKHKSNHGHTTDSTNRKGVYSQYLDQSLSGERLSTERSKQLQCIARIRKRPVVVMAASLHSHAHGLNSIDYSDIQAVADLIEELSGDSIDVLIETPGGNAEVVEDIARLLRSRFHNIGFIVPGWAKSAGTILAMAGDEILMGPSSALGPIDAQMTWKDKIFSADAFLEGLNKIKQEVEDPEKEFNRAYIPILQQISPGDIQTAQNALDFARELVAKWLEEYKFRDWRVHSTSQRPVTPQERHDTACRIANELCQHSKWLTHGRSINIHDLIDMGLRITDYTSVPDLSESIRRYYALLHITFESNMYKIFETAHRMIGRFINVGPPTPDTETVRQQLSMAQTVNMDTDCPVCSKSIPLQLKLAEDVPDTVGRIPYPNGGVITCPHCHRQINLAGVVQQFERDFRQEVLPS